MGSLSSGAYRALCHASPVREGDWSPDIRVRQKQTCVHGAMSRASSLDQCHSVQGPDDPMELSGQNSSREGGGSEDWNAAAEKDG